jgi:hypothetical protein
MKSQQNWEGTIKGLVIFGMLLTLYGCESVPSGRWEQPQRTDTQATEDLKHCEHVAILESDGQRSVEPFKKTIVVQNYIQRMGCKYVKFEPELIREFLTVLSARTEEMRISRSL